jgi:hypothetical protein
MTAKKLASVPIDAHSANYGLHRSTGPAQRRPNHSRITKISAMALKWAKSGLTTGPTLDAKEKNTRGKTTTSSASHSWDQ